MRSQIFPGPPGCPTLVVNGQPLDVLTFKPAGPVVAFPSSSTGRGRASGPRGFPGRGPARTQIAPDSPRCALSPNGQLVAALATDGRSLAVSAVASGDEKAHIDLEAPVRTVLFAGNDLLLCTDDSGAAALWDIASNKKLRALPAVHATGLNARGRLALSTSGHYLAAPDDIDILVIDTRTGARAAAMELPADLDFNTHARTEFLNAVGAMAFSPNSGELAAVSGGRLLVWNNHGQVVFDTDFHDAAGPVRQIAWLPDGSGWLLNGECLYLRSVKQFALVRAGASTSFDANPVGLLPSRTAFLSVAGRPFRQELRRFTIPWEKIDKAVAVANNPAAPLALKPGGSVALQFKLDPLGSSAQEARTNFQDALTHLLSNQNISVAASAPLKLVVEYTEGPGPAMPSDEHIQGRSIVSHGGADATPTTETIGTLHLSYVDAAGKTLWELPATRGFHYVYVQPDEESRRMFVTTNAPYLRRAPLPWLLTTDPNGPALPVFIPE
jgi:hypothetical protein